MHWAICNDAVILLELQFVKKFVALGINGVLVVFALWFYLHLIIPWIWYNMILLLSKRNHHRKKRRRWGMWTFDYKFPWMSAFIPCICQVVSDYITFIRLILIWLKCMYCLFGVRHGHLANTMCYSSCFALSTIWSVSWFIFDKCQEDLKEPKVKRIANNHRFYCVCFLLSYKANFGQLFPVWIEVR